VARPLFPVLSAPSRRMPIALAAAAAVGVSLVLLVACTASGAPQHAPPMPSIVSGSSRHASAPPAQAAAVTGFGALISDWNATHTPDHAFAAGSVYDPNPALPSINGHTGAVYVLVTPTNGRILSYAMNLPKGTSLRFAINAVRQQFPRDVHVLWTARKDACAQTQFASRILGRVLRAPAIGDSRGLVMVEFEDIDSSGNSVATPQVFNSASFNLGGTNSPVGSPGC
jgi:hypothetical protein